MLAFRDSFFYHVPLSGTFHIAKRYFMHHRCISYSFWEYFIVKPTRFHKLPLAVFDMLCYNKLNYADSRTVTASK